MNVSKDWIIRMFLCIPIYNSEILETTQKLNSKGLVI